MRFGDAVSARANAGCIDSRSGRASATPDARKNIRRSTGNTIVNYS
jgi:hypothetical protein